MIFGAIMPASLDFAIFSLHLPGARCRPALAAWSPPMLGWLAVAAFWAELGCWWTTLFAVANMAALVTALRLYARRSLDGDTLALGDDGMLVAPSQRDLVAQELRGALRLAQRA
ncbi:MAG: hypothetical protein JF607_21175 [Burkholderiales bacterium]|jgi:hypothetical protein|nr:hypothetical protein [Burkholderiales bacterium]